MAYTRVNWENLPSKNTPVNADNLNKMDEGIANIDTKIDAKANSTDVAEIKSDISNLQNNVFNVTETSANVNTNTIGKIDVNKIAVCGRIVHVVFRGYVENYHANNSMLLQLPDGIHSQIAEAVGFGIGGRYDISSRCFGYLDGSYLMTAAISQGSWVHINLTFIKA